MQAEVQEVGGALIFLRFCICPAEEVAGKEERGEEEVEGVAAINAAI